MIFVSGSKIQQFLGKCLSSNLAVIYVNNIPIEYLAKHETDSKPDFRTWPRTKLFDSGSTGGTLRIEVGIECELRGTIRQESTMFVGPCPWHLCNRAIITLTGVANSTGIEIKLSILLLLFSISIEY